MSLFANDSNCTAKRKRECLYDILNVSRNADNDQLKSAYKQQAKKWHPDRNMNNISEATQRFKEINEAYSILSDKHERAWYDAHRDAILRGIDPNDITFKSNNNNNNNNMNNDPDINLMPYFSPFIFTSFDDNDSNSYYNIYNNLFIQIIKLEKLSKKKTPIFGNSKLSFDKLNEFYNFWEIFESRRSFQFVIKYNLNDATNRKMRKYMHKENRHLINLSRKKWEESIMKLVSFIKKRDPRWRNYKIFIEKQKIEKELQMKEYKNEIEEIMRQQQKLEFKKELIKIEKEIENLNEPIEIEELFECIVCNKIFKSQGAFDTHENSKKHKKELHELKIQLNIENEIIFKNDYEIAIQMEREDIINSYLIGNDNNNNNNNIIITDEEIIALLKEPGIDIDTLIETYPILTEEYIMKLISEKKNKRKKNKKKKNRNMNMNIIITNNKEIKVKKEKKKKKRRRRDKTNKDQQNQMNLSSINYNKRPIKSKCKACDEMFASKSKLYNHLKSYPQHALKSQHQ